MALELTTAAKELLATRGFDPVLGARPLRRTVQRDIEDVLAEKMLYGEVGPGQIVLVDVDETDSEAHFTFTGTPKSELPDVPPVEEALPGTERLTRPRPERAAPAPATGSGTAGPSEPSPPRTTNPSSISEARARSRWVSSGQATCDVAGRTASSASRSTWRIAPAALPVGARVAWACEPAGPGGWP